MSAREEKGASERSGEVRGKKGTGSASGGGRGARGSRRGTRDARDVEGDAFVRGTNGTRRDSGRRTRAGRTSSSDRTGRPRRPRNTRARGSRPPRVSTHPHLLVPEEAVERLPERGQRRVPHRGRGVEDASGSRERRGGRPPVLRRVLLVLLARGRRSLDARERDPARSLRARGPSKTGGRARSRRARVERTASPVR